MDTLKLILKALETPEIKDALVVILTGIVSVLLGVNKGKTVQQDKTVVAANAAGHTAPEIAKVTTATVTEVAKILVNSDADASMNTNKKKIQRAARAALRGWLRF